MFDYLDFCIKEVRESFEEPNWHSTGTKTIQYLHLPGLQLDHFSPGDNYGSK